MISAPFVASILVKTTSFDDTLIASYCARFLSRESSSLSRYPLDTYLSTQCRNNHEYTLPSLDKRILSLSSPPNAVSGDVNAVAVVAFADGSISVDTPDVIRAAAPCTNRNWWIVNIMREKPEKEAL